MFKRPHPAMTRGVRQRSEDFRTRNPAASNSPSNVSAQAPVSNSIHAEPIQANIAIALGIKAVSATPILRLCRLLVQAGHDPTAPLDAYRGDILCLSVRGIGEAANIELSHHGGFIRRAARRARPLVHLNGRGQP
jgi:hypothetical protein